MASKGLRAISYQGTQKVEAGYNPSQNSETLIGYTACYAVGFFIYSYFQILQSVFHIRYGQKHIGRFQIVP